MMRYGAPSHVALLLALTLGLAPVRASAGPPATFAALKVGQVVSVDGMPAGGRAVQAQAIKIEDGPDEDKVKGPIEAITAKDQSFTVLGVKVIASPAASIADRDGRPLLLSDLRRGWVVKAKGELRQDGTLHASEIKVGNPASKEAEVQGKIEALDTGRRTLTIIGLTVRVTPATRITFD
jgi:hypothetical protein